MEEQNKSTFQLDDGFSTKAGNVSSASGASYSYHSTAEIRSESNLLFGLIGALIGAVPGCVLWILIGRIGFVAGIAGYAIMVGAMFCYKKLGGEPDKKGVIVCIAITVAAILLANILEFSFQTYDIAIEEGIAVSFFDVLTVTPRFIVEGGMLGRFVLNLIIGYALTAWSCARWMSSVFQ
ncbi:MAG: hypothetical protein IJR45_08340 [Firmicutes bacterium]|nr:hypothetical protein [Bacillota bacterium]MBQ9605405.1 hypothetical protein [Bacillota bacterium]